MKIDFVLTWVDNTDEVWQKAHENFLDSKIVSSSTSVNRYRDWDILKYWFRSVEKYAPWVNKIYLVTFGHVPDWLNLMNRKLEVINHEQIIPKDFLPTFNSRVIEMYLHRIPNLSEFFVYFNDDVFLNREIDKSYFFLRDLPRDCFFMQPLCKTNNINYWENIKLNCIGFINSKFKKSNVVYINFLKIMSIRNGSSAILNNLLQLPYARFSAFKDFHVSQPFLKSNFEAFWLDEYNYIEKMSNNRFRTGEDINQYIFRYYSLASGRFIPINKKKNTVTFNLTVDNYMLAIQEIQKSKYYEICLNDGDLTTNFLFIKRKIVNTLEEKFPEKCCFEQ